LKRGDKLARFLGIILDERSEGMTRARGRAPGARGAGTRQGGAPLELLKIDYNGPRRSVAQMRFKDFPPTEIIEPTTDLLLSSSQEQMTSQERGRKKKFIRKSFSWWIC